MSVRRRVAVPVTRCVIEVAAKKPRRKSKEPAAAPKGGKRGRGDRGQRFHFHAGLRGRPNTGFDLIPRSPGTQIDLDVRERQQVTQRDQIGCPLGRHNSGQPCSLQRISFGDSPAPDQLQCLGPNGDGAARDRLAAGHRFATNVDHPHVPRAVDVGQSPPCLPGRRAFPGCRHGREREPVHARAPECPDRVVHETKDTSFWPGRTTGSRATRSGRRS